MRQKPMSVISIRILRELKKKMDSLRYVVNWSEEVRRFIGGVQRD